MRNKFVTAVSVVALMTAAGCSGTSTNDSSNTSSEDAAANAEAAKEALAPLLKEDSTIKLEALPSKPPENQTVTFISGPLYTTQQIGSGVEAAVKALGWEYRVVQSPQTPDGYKSALEDVLQSPGDLLIAPANAPNEAVQAQIDELKHKGVAFIQFSGTDKVGDEMLAGVAAPNTLAAAGTAVGNWVVADSGGENVDVAIFSDQSYEAQRNADKGVLDALEKLCPGCETDVVNAPLAGIGTEIPKQVVSYVQRHPETDYLAFGFGDVTAGVGAALKAAGLADGVKIVSRFAGPANFANIDAGLETAGVAEEVYELGWRAVDTYVRHLMDVPFEDYPIGNLHLFTQDNLPADKKKYYSVPNYESYFLDAWNVS